MKTLLISIFFTIILTSVCLSQTEIDSVETSYDVPELFEFHKVIYPIWHTAYPEKDYEMLKGFVDEVNEGSAKIIAVELPGILRDKKERWNEGIERLKSSVQKYNSSAASGNNDELLKAAEELHTDFEFLVRVIRPVTKNVEEFHKLLYAYYHYYLPEKNYEAIKENASDLQALAGNIMNDDLPKWISDKQEEYELKAEGLYNASEELNKKSESVSDEELEQLVEKVHTKYMELEAVFD